MYFYYEVLVLGISLDTSFTYKSKSIIDINSFISVEFRNKPKKAFVLKSTNKPEYECNEIIEIHDLYLSKKYLDIANFIKNYYLCTLADAISLFTPFRKEQKFQDSDFLDFDINLSQNQTEAFEFIKKNKTSLLFGDTGSGKTEIYIKRFQEIINSNQSVIFLLPEISLTPQMIKRLEELFGNKVATWHSKLTKKKKNDILENIYNGVVKIVVGARSSLFLPMRNLGLIVVDEEHDDAYKSMQRPRYNAKDLSIYFAKVLDIHITLGSATPTLNSYLKLPNHRLKGTFFDTKKSFVFDNSDTKLNDFLFKSIYDTIENGNQVIVFLPTRANFKHLVCSDCFKPVQCPFCSVSLSLHRNDRLLKCHYCNYVEKILPNCPSCNDGILLNKRMGTAEIVDILTNTFRNYTIGKFDRDEIKSETKLKKVLKDFNDEKIDILVGTQMLSKGHDYHNVKLVIVMGIDNVLYIPDFRARENAMSLLVQISGRSGRKGDGKVIVQTQNQEFFQEYLNDYEKFINDELECRKELYPPYTKLVRIIFSHTNGTKACESMNQMLSSLRFYDRLEIVGYGEANIFKISNKYRYQILIRFSDINYALKALHSTKTSFCEIDMNPLNFS
jgi:primosomal protein N' (replication factor Y)